MKTSAVCFDLDGTLLNTIADLAAACNEVLLAHGYPEHAAEVYAGFVGDGAAMLMERALPHEARQARHIAECLQAFQQAYAGHWNRRSQLYAGIADVLNELTQRKIKLSVLSNKPHAFTELCVHHYFEAWSFDAVLGQRDGIPKKPDPAGALEIARALDLNPNTFLFVGDSGVDMATGRAAGMRSIGVSWGYRPVAEIKSQRPTAIINHPEELLAYLER